MKQLSIICILLFHLTIFGQDNTLSQQEKTDGWQLLFDGKSFNNWQVDKWNPKGFSVIDGSIKCNGKRSMLYYNGPKKEFTDFHFVADVMTKERANSGIFFHTKYQDKGWPIGHEAQVNCSQGDPVKTGSIYVVKKYLQKAHKDGEWFRYEIIVKGKTVTTKVNGKTLVTYKETNSKGRRKLSSGTFGLQAHDKGSTVFYKNIKVNTSSNNQASAAPTRAQLVASRKGRWYEKMDFGPALAMTVGIDSETVLKGLSVRLGASETHTMIYDTEMMSFNGAKSGFVKIHGTAWNGSHGGFPTSLGLDIKSSLGPGWAQKGSFDDPRKVKYGPLPKEWVKYKGHYRSGNKVVLRYTVGQTEVLEMPVYEEHAGVNAYSRVINIDSVGKAMTMMVLKSAKSAQILGENGPQKDITVGISGQGLKLRRTSNGSIVADIAAGQKIHGKIIMAVKGDLAKAIGNWPSPEDISSLTKGGSIQWPGTFKVKGVISKSKGPYTTEEIPLPAKNPWGSNIRFSGFDFFADGKRAAICTWNGDVWIVSGIDKDLQNLTWKRYAAGLFETLGLKIVDDVIYVTCKDQIARLHDINKDGEADYYECFNNDIMITDNFHEFTFDLQTDSQGNFYFAKAAPVRQGGRGFGTTHAHHVIVFKVSKDGLKSEVHGSGLRAPGGMGVGPNGEVTTGENEGSFVPACKINWVTKGSFSGVIHTGNGRTMKQGYSKPLCWLPMNVDNSGGSQIWVKSEAWGPFNGDLLHLSYGRSTVYKVMKEDVDGTVQGGVFALPIKLTSSAMRARFNPVDKQLYVSGFKGWQTNAAKASSLQRIRFNGAKVNTPLSMRATKKGIYISFTEKLDKELAEDPGSYSIKWWKYLWTPMYGSGHFSVSNVDEVAEANAMKKESKKYRKEDKVPVKSVTLQADGKTVFIEIPGIRPVMQMEISLDLETVDGDEIITKIYNTIHKLAD